MSHHCEICDYTFADKKTLKRHNIRTHPLPKKIQSKCSLCDYLYYTPQALEKHMSLHTHTSTQKPHKCQICGKGMSDKSKLKDHMKRCHSSNIVHENSDDESDSDSYLSDSDTSIKPPVYPNLQNCSVNIERCDVTYAGESEHQSHAKVSNQTEIHSGVDLAEPPPIHTKSHTISTNIVETLQMEVCDSDADSEYSEAMSISDNHDQNTEVDVMSVVKTEHSDSTEDIEETDLMYLYQNMDSQINNEVKVEQCNGTNDEENIVGLTPHESDQNFRNDVKCDVTKCVQNNVEMTTNNTCQQNNIQSLQTGMKLGSLSNVEQVGSIIILSSGHCLICKQSYPNIRKHHIDVHRKKNQCAYCSFTSEEPAMLKLHHTQKHPGSCQHCDFLSIDMDTLKTHVSEKHAGVEHSSNTLVECDKNLLYVDKEALLAHKQTCKPHDDPDISSSCKLEENELQINQIQPDGKPKLNEHCNKSTKREQKLKQQRERRQNRTSAEREKVLNRQRERYKNMTSSQREKMLNRQRERRKNLTSPERERRRKRNHERRSAKPKSEQDNDMTSTECETQLNRQRERQQNMTCHEREKKRNRQRERRKNLTSPEREKIRNQQRERRKNWTSSQREKVQNQDRERRKNMTSKQKSARAESERIRRQRDKEQRCSFLGQTNQDHVQEESSTNQGASLNNTSLPNEMKQPIRTEPDKSLVFECSACDYKDWRLNCLLRHITYEHIALNLINTICKLCGYQTNDATDLQAHIKRYSHDKCFTCEQCSATFIQPYRLRHHIQKTHEHATNKVVCPYCGRKYQRSSLKQHFLNEHNIGTPFLCNHCGKRFTSPKKLKRHILNDHIGDISCTQCDFTCKTQETLDLHMVKHTGIKGRLTCDICGQSRNTLRSFWSHMRSHTDIKSFKCPHCEYSTAARNNLTKHIACMHINEKPFSCDLCDYRANQKVSLVSHKQHKHHGGYKVHKCTEPGCDFQVKWISSFKKHKLKEHGIVAGRIYHCPHCEYKTITKIGIDDHIRIHTGEKPYECPHCVFRCSVLSNLKSHIKTHTKTKP